MLVKKQQVNLQCLSTSKLVELIAMKTIAERVTYAREQARLSQSELARRIGVKPQTIQQIESGETQKSRYLPDIAEETKFSYRWIKKGVGHERIMQTNVRPGPDIVGTVPLISSTQAGSWREACNVLGPGQEERRIATTKKVGPRSYALEVEGDSMVNSSGEGDSFPPGVFIICDPDWAYKPGDYVIARIDGTDDTTFKKLVKDGNDWYLAPLNNRYRMRQIDPTIVICAVVRQMVKDFN